MAFIRDRKEERTGFQCGQMPQDRSDFQNDFVMVYRVDDSTLERIRLFRERGYIIHLMTGIAWGHYQDYLYGRWDGREHWDEAQTDRFGNHILHNPDIPYMVPTVSFADYLTEKLKVAVDAGVEAIHVEEPEFWDRGGYSEAFKREYRMYYREDWKAPHESVDAKYKCSKLKAYLYTRTIDRLASSLKEYAMTKHGRALRFYVPTHSLVNYTQWKIVSPEGKLADIPAVDGCIAQVWTGTSREKNWYNGRFAERTFETAFLEYGVMQELVKGTGRTMWFLNDPIEDNPIFDWTDYRENYLRTITASLLHPKVNTYEICPWPNRVFYDKYPRGAENAEPIPPEYATILNNMFQTLGAIENKGGAEVRVGILAGDCQLYQREYPDCEFSEEIKERVGTVLVEDESLVRRFENELMKSETPDRELMLRFMSSNAFPAFFSLALPLLKAGIPVRPVLLDNARRYVGYLDDYDVLLMSYEYMKPDYPDINAAIAEWVRRGGQLIYAGDGFDPFHGIRSWWTGKYPTAAEHLFEMLGVEPKREKEIFDCGKGTAAVWKINPSVFSFSAENADALRAFFADVLARQGKKAEFRNYLLLERGVYTIAAVMDESVDDKALKLDGLFTDMYSPDFAVLHGASIAPGENKMLLDYSRIEDETLCVVGTSLRVNALEEKDGAIVADVRGAADFRAYLRLRVPFKPTEATIDGAPCALTYDEDTRTALVSFESVVGERKIVLK
ncbi:MAG: hypothetical protein IJK23_14120 [Clostridia bacterium]|nr:hypothetical protein [Clostridia bacterium]